MTETKHRNLKHQLRHIFKEDQIKFDQNSLDYYGKDWTNQYKPSPQAVVFPTTTAEVQSITLLANEQHLALVPSGGRTGLSGGAVAQKGEIVVSFERMNQLSDFNKIDKTIKCEAGVVTQSLQQYAIARNLFYPVDFASSGSSHVGGNIATNAGGINVIRYGMTRQWVAGLTFVTGKGDILVLNKDLIKNNAGYDLKQLFIGSEGTLGFVTEATMRLTTPPKELHVLLLAINDFKDIMHVLHTFEHQLTLNAFEFFSELAMNKVLAQGHVPKPMQSNANYFALVEFEATTDEHLTLALSLFEQCVENAWVIDGVMSQSESQKENLWRLREDITEAIADCSPYKNDISVCVSKTPLFLQEVNAIFKKDYANFEIIWFGHIADGNVHIAVLKPDELNRADFIKKCDAVSQKLFEMIQQYNGSISAEHGVGLTKKPFMHYQCADTEVQYLKLLKNTFDPNNVMNPGKLIDP